MPKTKNFFTVMPYLLKKRPMNREFPQNHIISQMTSRTNEASFSLKRYIPIKEINVVVVA